MTTKKTTKPAAKKNKEAPSKRPRKTVATTPFHHGGTRPGAGRHRSKFVKPPTDVTGVRLPIWVLNHHAAVGAERNMQLGTHLAKILIDLAKQEGAIEPPPQMVPVASAQREIEAHRQKKTRKK